MQTKMYRPRVALSPSPSSKSSEKSIAAIKIDCLQKRLSFNDTEFNRRTKQTVVTHQLNFEPEWRRPTDIVSKPVFIHPEGDAVILPGLLSNDWVLAAISEVRSNPALFNIIVPERHSFEENYFGIFSFSKWADVLVDDFLPTHPTFDTILYAHSNHDDEFWIPLLEKAFIKCLGSYRLLRGLTPIEIFSKFTGGICETTHLSFEKSQVVEQFKRILHRYKRNALIVLRSKIFINRNKIGIPPECLFVVTKIEDNPINRGNVHVFQLKSPTGEEIDWKGDWNKNSVQWMAFSSKYRQHVLKPEDKSMFCISHKDVLSVFDIVVMCNYKVIGAKSNPEQRGKLEWDVTIWDGKWIRERTSGGLPSSRACYRSPQYRFEILKKHLTEEENKTTLISLVQKVEKYEPNVYIQFFVYKLEANAPIHHLMRRNLDRMQPIAQSQLSNETEVILVTSFPPGVYMIMPCVKIAGEEARYCLKLFTENQHNIPLGGVEEETTSYVPQSHLQFSLSSPIEVLYGSTIRISLIGANTGKSNLSIAVKMGFLAKKQDIFKPLKTIHDIITLNASTDIELPIWARYHVYAPSIEDRSCLYAVLEVTVLDYNYYYRELKMITVVKPKIEFDMELSHTTAFDIRIFATFKNPFPRPLRHGAVSVEGSNIASQTTYFDEIPANDVLNIRFAIPKTEGVGNFVISIILQVKPLGNIKTTVEMEREKTKK